MSWLKLTSFKVSCRTHGKSRIIFTSESTHNCFVATSVNFFFKTEKRTFFVVSLHKIASGNEKYAQK